MAKDRLPKGPALYFRLEQHYQVAAFDVLALAKLHPHPADSLGRVTERAFCLMVDELRRQGLLPEYKSTHDIMMRFAHFKPDMFAGLKPQPKLQIASEESQIRQKVNEEIEVTEAATEHALWLDELQTPWESLVMLPAEQVRLFLDDNPEEPIAKHWNDDEDDEARIRAYQVVLASLPDETWLSEPVLKSIKVRTLEYRSYFNDQERQEAQSDTADTPTGVRPEGDERGVEPRRQDPPGTTDITDEPAEADD